MIKKTDTEKEKEIYLDFRSCVISFYILISLNIVSRTIFFIGKNGLCKIYVNGTKKLQCI